jgi:PilZ domain-containing protein
MLRAAEVIGFLTFTFLVLLLLDRLWLPKWSSPPPKVRDQRRGPRYAVHCPVTYAMHNAEAEAIVVDMSREGWRLQSGKPVAVGTVLRLQIVVPFLAQPIPIEQAIVRWSNRAEFGIQLLVLDVGAAAQLSEYLSMVERQGLSSALAS